MKKIILFTIALLMSISFVLAAPPDFPVGLSYTDSSTDGRPLVADVPFDVTVSMDTHNNDVLSYNLYVSSSDARALFTSANRGQLFPQNDLDANSGPQSSNTIYRYQVKPKVGYVGNSADKAVSIFSLRTTIPGITPSIVELKRDGTAIHADNVITPAATGASIEAINDATHTITPQLSTCSDGVVGYIERGTPNGIWEQETEGLEACDEGTENNVNKNVAAGGCSANCAYIELGYYCHNAKFGDRGSVCTPLSPKEFLIQKLTALIKGQCYPDCAHPMAMYKADASLTPRITYDNEKIDASEKIYMLAQIGVALREFFSQVMPVASPATPSEQSVCWQCNSWGTCTSNTQTRSCARLQPCNMNVPDIIFTEPVLTRACRST